MFYILTKKKFILHETLPNKLLVKIHIILLIGPGTGSYFDYVELPFKITKLETSIITFRWYVVIKSKLFNFLESHKGDLNELNERNLRTTPY